MTSATSAVRASSATTNVNPRPRTITVADLFCGAGGSSTGAKRALKQRGFRMRLLAVNHWRVAVETHKKMHPEAIHYCEDVNTLKPYLVVPSGKLDLLMASPTCVHHSRARGGKPTSDQQRQDPWAIIRWLTELRVRCLLVENVPEFVSWGPINPRTGRPIKGREGQYFRQWIETIKSLGFRVDWRVLCSADFGDATTRRRFFLIARSDRKPLRWPAPTHARVPHTDPLFGTKLERWRPARDIIDWGLRGKSIFTRKKALSPKTLARIYAGMVKFKWPEPFLVILRQHMTARGVDLPLPALTANGQHVGLVQPFIFANRNNNVAKNPATDPAPTNCSRGNVALVEPFIATVAHGNETTEQDPNTRRRRSLAEPLQTIEAGGGKFGVVEPFIATVAHGNHTAERNPDAHRCRSLEEPLQTIHAGGGKFGVVEPFVFRMNQGKKRFGEQRPVSDPLCTVTASGTDLGIIEPFVLPQGSEGTPQSTTDPLSTVVTVDRHAIVQPFILNRHGDRDGTNAARAHSVDEPTPTATCEGAGYVVEPFVLSQASGGAPRSTDDPLPTATTDGAHALVAPYYGSGSGKTCRSVEQPLPTATAKARFGLVLPVTHHDGADRARDVDTQPLPTVTGAHRGELAFITTGFGERDGRAARVHSVEQPAPTVCADGHLHVVQPGQGYDILFRMLEPHELSAAMSFDSDEARYEFCGTKTDIVRQIGNAVSVRLAMALVGALFDD